MNNERFRDCWQNSTKVWEPERAAVAILRLPEKSMPGTLEGTGSGEAT